MYRETVSLSTKLLKYFIDLQNFKYLSEWSPKFTTTSLNSVLYIRRLKHLRKLMPKPHMLNQKLFSFEKC